jgi:hypothetical protein
MFDFITSALLTPGPAWIGIALGLIAAYLAWTYLPESVDRTSIAAWLIAIGFAGGLLWAAAGSTKKE